MPPKKSNKVISAPTPPKRVATPQAGGFFRDNVYTTTPRLDATGMIYRPDALTNFGLNQLPDDDFTIAPSTYLHNMDYPYNIQPSGSIFRPEQSTLEPMPFSQQSTLKPSNQHHQQPLHQAQLFSPEEFVRQARRIGNEDDEDINEDGETKEDY